MRAVLYARFSPRPNAAKSESIKAQLEACRGWCAKEGHEVAGEHVDREKSRNDADRPGLWAAIAEVKRGWALVVYRADRLASGDLAAVLRRNLKRNGVSLLAVEGSVNGEGPEAELVNRVLDAISEYERQVIAARTKHAMLRHQGNGRRMSDKTPYGWCRSERDPAMLVEDHDEQAVISEVLRLRRLKPPTGFEAIADLLNELDIEARGERWYATTIVRIVKRAAKQG